MDAKEITADTVKRIHASMANNGREVTYEIQNMWDSAIASFYSAYFPHQYIRTGNTYNASDKGANNFCTVNGDTVTVRCGIVVDSSFMDDVYKHHDVDTVFSNTYDEGIHGTPTVCISTPPREIFESWFLGMIGSFIARLASF